MKTIGTLLAALLLSLTPVWAGSGKTCGCEKADAKCVCKTCTCGKPDNKCTCNACPSPCVAENCKCSAKK